MSDIIKMNYQVMEEAAATYKQAAATSEEMIAEVKVISSILEGGGLLGRAGDAFVEGLNNNLCAALTRLCDKYNEVNGDLLSAMETMQSTDSDTTRFYN